MASARLNSAAGVLRKSSESIVAGEQTLHFAAQFVVARAQHTQVSGAILLRTFQRSVKNLTDLRPSLGRQAILP